MQKHLGISRLNDAVRRVLTEMFAFRMVANPPSGNINAVVATAAHATFARQAAESSIVLLKNTGDVLPLQPKTLGSVAVIGHDAGQKTMSAGYGSSTREGGLRGRPVGSSEAGARPQGKGHLLPGRRGVTAPAGGPGQFAGGAQPAQGRA